MSASPTITIALIEDDLTYRDGLRSLIETKPGYACIGAFDSVDDAIETLPAPGPDVFLLDVRLPDGLGSRFVRHLLDRFPSSTVVMLTQSSDDVHVFEALCNGASGYLLKRSAARILEGVREAKQGGSPMSPTIARRVVEMFRRFPAAGDSARLTPQETRFLSLLSQGRSYRTAAAELGVSENTVRNYVRGIYEKLQVHSAKEAVAKALRAGII
jgi:DNA-binding NarL/FixJ family response regulator